MSEHDAVLAAQQTIRDVTRVAIRGGGTKSGFHEPMNGDCILSTMALAGWLEYDPSEYTFTALAGTAVLDIQQRLAGEGQYLPFDPPLVDAGATLGGTVAAGMSGACRLAHGGLRDFILGIRFIDGSGQLVRAGGKVVKNSAGFDLPKFFVGSEGKFGLLTEITCKVFPRPTAFATLFYQYASIEDVVAAVVKLLATPMRLDAIDVGPQQRMAVRFGGEPGAIERQGQRLVELLGEATTEVSGEAEIDYWRGIREFDGWDATQLIVKVPLTPYDVVSLEQGLQTLELTRRYSAARSMWRGLPCPTTK